jgi:hypothetical protein
VFCFDWKPLLYGAVFLLQEYYKTADFAKKKKTLLVGRAFSEVTLIMDF